MKSLFPWLGSAIRFALLAFLYLAICRLFAFLLEPIAQLLLEHPIQGVLSLIFALMAVIFMALSPFFGGPRRLLTRAAAQIQPL
ncbi:TPA: hypothetical protein MNK97_005287 [Klebsiella pneumoniae]|nr:hypothetical protein [Klebsiella pneumoniae]